jgi:serine/threonine protein kinase
METSIINTKILKTLHNSTQNFSNINKSKTYINTLSYVDMTPRKIYVVNELTSGSYNTIYRIKRKKNGKIEQKLILRLSKKPTIRDSIKMELNGIQIQYNLSKLSNNIGLVIDYGRLLEDQDINHQEYSIIEKYGNSLKTFLECDRQYKNIMTPLYFIKQFLKTIDIIHSNKYAHLDLKPSNILLKNLPKSKTIKISHLDFAIIDFGATKAVSEKSTFMKQQMASAAFSPPEILNRYFGKANDIWAFGVISYLVLLNKFFFKADGVKMFINKDKTLLKKSIERGLSNISNKLIPENINKDKYLNILVNPINLDILRDFFLNVFTIDYRKRPNTKKLLKHKLFTLIK